MSSPKFETVSNLKSYTRKCYILTTKHTFFGSFVVELVRIDYFVVKRINVIWTNS